MKVEHEREIKLDADPTVELGDLPGVIPGVVPELSESPTGREVVHASIARSVTHLLLHLPIARLGQDPEGVHQARVATRRLRSDLRTFHTMVDSTWADRMHSELRWMGGMLGSVRDDDVLIAKLESLGAVRSLVHVIEDERQAHHRELREAIHSPRGIRLLEELVAAAQDPTTTPRADDPACDLITPTLKKRWKRVRRAVDRLGPEPTDAQLHQLRILVKRCRYAVDAASVVFGRRAEKSERRLSHLQDVLGDVNDAAVISARMRQLANGHPDVAFAAGEVAGRLTTTAAAGRDRWRRAWAKASRKKLWRWL